MFELEHDTAAAVEHSAKVGLVAATILLVIQAAFLFLGRIEPDVQDLGMFALIVLTGSDACSRLWSHKRRFARSLRVLSWLSMLVAVTSLTVSLFGV